MATKYFDDGGADGNLSTAANYDSDTAPSSGDSLYVEQGANNIEAGLTALSNGTLSGNLALLAISAAFTKRLGSAAAYAEIGATAAELGFWRKQSQIPAGSDRLKIDFGSQATQCRVYRTAQTDADANLEPCQLLFASASAALQVHGKSRVGVATVNPAETSQLLSVEVFGDDSRFNGGPGLTLATLDAYAGLAIVQKAPTTINARGGTVQVRATSGTTTTARAQGGYLDLRGAGITITNPIEAYAGSTIDLRGFVGTQNGIKLMDGKGVTVLGDAELTLG